MQEKLKAPKDNSCGVKFSVSSAKIAANKGMWEAGADLRVWNRNKTLWDVGKFNLKQGRPLRREHDASAALILQHPTARFIDEDRHIFHILYHALHRGSKLGCRVYSI